MEDLNTEMLSAAFDGDLASVEKPVSRGADINYTDARGNFAMFTAAWEGNTKALDLFYRLGAKISFDDANLLCNAAYNGKADSVRWLLDKGENANFTLSKCYWMQAPSPLRKMQMAIPLFPGEAGT
jgi:ankyrin repeat protein